MIPKKILLLVGVLGLLVACNDNSAYLIGVWTDFNQSSFEVTVSNKDISVKQGNSTYEKKGHWENNTFYCSSDSSPPAEVAVAHELANESLQVEMKYFNPTDTSVFICTKTQRGYNEANPTPTSDSGAAVTYPPPKGAIKVGMLEADLQYLPWKSYKVEMQGNDSIHGPNIYCYRTDDPKLPELRVTVFNGSVTEVVGGAEDEPDSSALGSTNNGASSEKTPASSPQKDNFSWTLWLFKLIFDK